MVLHLLVLSSSHPQRCQQTWFRNISLLLQRVREQEEADQLVLKILWWKTPMLAKVVLSSEKGVGATRLSAKC